MLLPILVLIAIALAIYYFLDSHEEQEGGVKQRHDSAVADGPKPTPSPPHKKPTQTSADLREKPSRSRTPSSSKDKASKSDSDLQEPPKKASSTRAKSFEDAEQPIREAPFSETETSRGTASKIETVPKSAYSSEKQPIPAFPKSSFEGSRAAGLIETEADVVAQQPPPPIDESYSYPPQKDESEPVPIITEPPETFPDSAPADNGQPVVSDNFVPFSTDDQPAYPQPSREAVDVSSGLPVEEPIIVTAEEVPRAPTDPERSATSDPGKTGSKRKRKRSKDREGSKKKKTLENIQPDTRTAEVIVQDVTGTAGDTAEVRRVESEGAERAVEPDDGGKKDGSKKKRDKSRSKRKEKKKKEQAEVNAQQLEGQGQVLAESAVPVPDNERAQEARPEETSHAPLDNTPDETAADTKASEPIREPPPEPTLDGEVKKKKEKRSKKDRSKAKGSKKKKQKPSEPEAAPEPSADAQVPGPPEKEPEHKPEQELEKEPAREPEPEKEPTPEPQADTQVETTVEPSPEEALKAAESESKAAEGKDDKKKKKRRSKSKGSKRKKQKSSEGEAPLEPSGGPETAGAPQQGSSIQPGKEPEKESGEQVPKEPQADTLAETHVEPSPEESKVVESEPTPAEEKGEKKKKKRRDRSKSKSKSKHRKKKDKKKKDDELDKTALEDAVPFPPETGNQSAEPDVIQSMHAGEEEKQPGEEKEALAKEEQKPKDRSKKRSKKSRSKRKKEKKDSTAEDLDKTSADQVPELPKEGEATEEQVVAGTGEGPKEGQETLKKKLPRRSKKSRHRRIKKMTGSEAQPENASFQEQKAPEEASVVSAAQSEGGEVKQEDSQEGKREKKSRKSKGSRKKRSKSKNRLPTEPEQKPPAEQTATAVAEGQGSNDPKGLNDPELRNADIRSANMDTEPKEETRQETQIEQAEPTSTFPVPSQHYAFNFHATSPAAALVKDESYNVD